MKNKAIVIGIGICLILFSGCSQSQESNNKLFSDINFSQEIKDISETDPFNKTISKDKMSNLLKKAKLITNKPVKESKQNEESVINEPISIVEEPTYSEENIEEQSIYNDENVEEFVYNENIEEESTYSEEIENNTVNTDGLTTFNGVNYYDGRTETYYSSNVLYHQDTDEWTADDEGFYRTDEGYYVVAASDMPQGTTFEGSKGTCIVLDNGCDEGVTDYYVNWP